MGKDCSSWYYQQQFPWQSFDMNRWSTSHGLDHQNGPSTLFSNLDNPYIDVRGFPMFKEVDHTLAPYYQHQSTLRSSHGAGCPVSPQLAATLNKRAVNLPKNFLIFDHTVNRTSLFVSALNQQVAEPKSIALPTDRITQENIICPAMEGKSTWRELDQAVISGGQKSEMHEDTEELNALLYSDDDIDEDEEASTGHSPFPFFGEDDIEVVCYNNEVINSSTKRKRLDDELAGPSLMDTASSGMMIRVKSSDDEDFNCAAFSGVGGNDDDAHQRCSWSCGNNKRAKKERIRETVTILRNIIPGSEGKEATVVIDEAIKYLKSLKLKAKTLGVGEVI